MDDRTDLPDRFVEQRINLHRLAMYAIAPVRHAETERFGLRSTPGGFGTPEFGEPPRRIRVEGVDLIDERRSGRRSTVIRSLRAAAEFLDAELDLELTAEHDSPPPGDLDEDLGITDAAVAVLADWWALGTDALEALRGDDASVDPSIVQLWPGHFDAAIEVGDEDRRASIGASPGDDSSDDPYLYVSVWYPDRLDLDVDDPYWNGDGFVGARLTRTELGSAPDRIGAAVAFFREGRDRLAAAGPKED